MKMTPKNKDDPKTEDNLNGQQANIFTTDDRQIFHLEPWYFPLCSILFLVVSFESLRLNSIYLWNFIKAHHVE